MPSPTTGAGCCGSNGGPDPRGLSLARPQVDHLHVDAPDTPREQIGKLVTLVENRSPIRDTLVSPVDVVTTLA
jgi:hypothetical protein